MGADAVVAAALVAEVSAACSSGSADRAVLGVGEVEKVVAISGVSDGEEDGAAVVGLVALVGVEEAACSPTTAVDVLYVVVLSAFEVE